MGANVGASLQLMMESSRRQVDKKFHQGWRRKQAKRKKSSSAPWDKRISHLDDVMVGRDSRAPAGWAKPFFMPCRSSRQGEFPPAGMMINRLF